MENSNFSVQPLEYLLIVKRRRRQLFSLSSPFRFDRCCVPIWFVMFFFLSLSSYLYLISFRKVKSVLIHSPFDVFVVITKSNCSAVIIDLYVESALWMRRITWNAHTIIGIVEAIPSPWSLFSSICCGLSNNYHRCWRWWCSFVCL